MIQLLFSTMDEVEFPSLKIKSFFLIKSLNSISEFVLLNLLEEHDALRIFNYFFLYFYIFMKMI